MHINGTYTSGNGDFALTITNSNETTGSFNGTYVAKQTPQGQQTFDVIGHWQYVSNPGGSLVPLNLSFTAYMRPEGWPYAMRDTWSGGLTQRGKITAIGVRSYLAAGGQPALSDLGTHSLNR